jgi:hypothetical protein
MAVVVPVISTFDDRGVTRAIRDFKKLDSFSSKSAMGLLSINKGATQLGKTFAKVGGIAGGLVGVVGSQLVAAAYESQKVMAQTNAIIKATGGAANITGEQVSDLSRRLSYQTGVDDELIQSSANLLLTFKAVKNQVGENNDIFNQAVQASLDLGNVFGSSDAAAKQLGKALSDPIKGVTALKKAGVDFTDKQRAQIRTLVESGRVLEAQKIILKEVQSQVGGTAAASATGFDRMKVAIGNLAEDLGTMLIPYVERFSKFVVDNVVPAMENFRDIVGRNGIGAGIEYLVGSLLGGIWNMGKLGKTIVFVAGAFAALKVATIAYRGAMAAMNIVLTLSNGALAQLITRLGQTKIAMMAAGGLTALLTVAAALYGAYASNKAKAETQTRNFVEALKLEGQAQLDALVNLYKSDSAFRTATNVLKTYGGSIQMLSTYLDDGSGRIGRWTGIVEQVTQGFDNLNQATQNATGGAAGVATGYDTLRSKIPMLRNATNAQIDTFIAAIKTFGRMRAETLSTQEATELFTKSLGLNADAANGASGANGGLGNTVKTAKEQFRDYTSALRDTSRAQKDVASATKATKKAQTDLDNATKAVTDAQTKLNQIASGYGAGSTQAKTKEDELAQAKRDSTRAGFDLVRAQNAVTDAQVALSEAQASGDPREITEAQMTLTEAQLALEEQQIKTAEATTAVTTAQTALNETVSGASTDSQTYKDALIELQDAQAKQQEAIDNLAAAKDREVEATQRLIDKEKELIDLRKQTGATVVGRAETQFAKQGGTLPQSTIGKLTKTTTAGGKRVKTKIPATRIPAMATGGIVMTPTLALIGEKAPEAVVPLSKMGAMGGDTYNITINSKIADASLPDIIVAELRKFNRRSGAINIQVA